MPRWLRRLPLSLWMCLTLLLPAPGCAQEAVAPGEYPTLAALQQAAIPAADYIALARALRGVTEIPVPPESAPVRQAGERAKFTASNSLENIEFTVPATLRAVGDHIYLWAQDGAPLPDDRLQALAHAFDTIIYPAVRALWGEEDSPGVDGDPRLYGLFAYGLGRDTLAYFASRHTYPAQVFPSSNQHEMFFFNLDAMSNMGLTDPASLAVQSVVAHEFQHMIRDNIQRSETLWLNEGFSVFTQLVLFQDNSFIDNFLQRPWTQLNTWSEDGPRLPHYGAALLFVTYFVERYGEDALRDLSLDPATGLESVDRVLRARGEPGVDTFFADWTLANLLLDPATGYGYSLLAPGHNAPPPRAVVSAYPFSATGLANPYSADYYTLSQLNGRDSLTVRLDAPDTVGLLPVEAAEGRWVWYSNRGDLSDMTLTRAFDLTSVTGATLHYRAWYDIEDYWDYAYVQASTDGGQTWDVLRPTSATDHDPYTSAYGPGYTGVSGGWRDESVSLDAYAGGAIQLRFQLITDDGINQPGLAIDDLSIPEIGYRDGFEADGGGWEARGWLRSDNRLPQQVWVQAVQMVDGRAQVTRWLAGGAGEWTLPLADSVEQVFLVLAPFAPTTTVPIPYTLSVE